MRLQSKYIIKNYIFKAIIVAQKMSSNNSTESKLALETWL